MLQKFKNSSENQYKFVKGKNIHLLWLMYAVTFPTVKQVLDLQPK